MEPSIEKRFEELERKIDAVYISSEKVRKYFLTTLIVTVVLFVLPLIGLVFAIPSFMSSYASIGNLDSLTQ